MTLHFYRFAKIRFLRFALALHDRAFDRGLMFIDEAMSVRFREKIIRCEKKSPGLDWLLSYEGKRICMPRKFRPDSNCLAKHRS